MEKVLTSDTNWKRGQKRKRWYFVRSGNLRSIMICAAANSILPARVGLVSWNQQEDVCSLHRWNPFYVFQFISWQIPRWPWSAKILTASCWCTAVHWDDKKSSQVSSRCKMLTRKNVSGYGRSEWSWRGSRRLWEGGRREKYCLGAEPATCLTSNSPDIITSPIPLDPTYDIPACT